MLLLENNKPRVIHYALRPLVKPFIKPLVNFNFFLYTFHASHLRFMQYPLQTALKDNFSFHICLLHSLILSNLALHISFPLFLCFQSVWLEVWLQPGSSVNPRLLLQRPTVPGWGLPFSIPSLRARVFPVVSWFVA